MTKITTAAHTLAANLAGKNITIKHVQALDLLAAGAGLANRHVLSTLSELPAIKRVNLALLTSAASVLARHDLGRRQTIIDETSSILNPIPVNADEPIEISERSLSIYPVEVGNPDAFLGTDRGQAFIKHLTRNLYYSRYYRDRSDGPLEMRRANELAEMILNAKRSSDAEVPEHLCVNDALEAFYGYGYGPHRFWWDEAREDVENTLDDVADQLEEHDLELDKEDWLSALEEYVLDVLVNDDDSAVTDLLDSFDKCEVIFFLKPEGYVIDQMISSNRPWADYADLHVGPELQHALAALGYTVGEYREISGNRNASEDLNRSIRKRRERLINPDQLKEIIENACAQNFLFALYAVVPVRELLELDLNKPITFSQAAVATYNPFSGTFMDVIRKQPITVTPKDGELRSGAMGYSPDGICGLHLPAYYATLKNETVPDSSSNLPLAA